MTIPKSQKLQNEEAKATPDQVDSNGPLKNFSSCDKKSSTGAECSRHADHADYTAEWKPLNSLVIVKCTPVEESIIITNVSNAPAFKFEGIVLSVADDVTNVKVGSYVKFTKAGIVSDNVNPADSSVVLVNSKSILCSR